MNITCVIKCKKFVLVIKWKVIATVTDKNLQISMNLAHMNIQTPLHCCKRTISESLISPSTGQPASVEGQEMGKS